MKSASPARIALLLLPAFALAAHAAPAGEARVNFDRDIRPVLSNNCFKCHGPDEKQRQAGLRLDTSDGPRAELKNGHRPVVPGNRSASALVARITAADPSERMPPSSSGKKLSPEQIELLCRWVDEGAEWRPHWSFVAPSRPAPPAVKHEAFVRNPIDRFVLAQLEEEHLQPSAAADELTLVRRLTYDLTGLPPTPAELDAFLHDDAPDAYEKLVDRLLASPRYGEHMARYWLDAARYGDTHGLHFDNERSLWPYRDWVIRAFNHNLGFDQFTIDQIAGDLLPGATRDQQIATGFNRCNVSTSEGGSIDDEVLVRYAVDRTETASTVFLGHTLGCAVCHDHQFDPVTQKEFYQLFAFFNNAADKAMDGNAFAPAPIIKLPTPERAAELRSLDEQIALARRNISDALVKIDYTDPDASAPLAAAEPREYVWIDDELPAAAQPAGDTPWQFVAKPEHPVLSGEKSSTRTAPGLSQHFFTGASPGLMVGEADRLFAYVYLDPANPPRTVMLQFNDGSWEHRAYWGEDLIPFGAGGSSNHLAMGALPAAGAWVRLEVEAARVGLQPGSVLNGWAFTQYGGTVHWDKAGIVTRTPQGAQPFESQRAWEAAERAKAKSELPKPVQDAIKLEPAARSAEQNKLVRDHFLERVCPKTRSVFAPLHTQFDSLAKQHAAVEAAIPTTMVMAEMPEHRDTFLLIRGAYNQKGDKVSPGVPSILPAMPKDAAPDRIGLARWLTDPSHPLTARVTVNRFWQQFFGRGIVKTANDFGSQGEWPSHPELLDWLACEFMNPVAGGQGGGAAAGKPHAWDIKHIVRLIVTSAVYRQSSDLTPDALKQDPENALLARGPRFRLDAEEVRDTALAVSGLLVERIGGHSVKPYQPPGIWEAVGFLGSNTREYKRDAGDALYRRSLYTFWKRTSPPPSLTTFDAPSRETCVVRRARTNTPLQALVLMNDEQFVEASRRFARRMIQEGGGTPNERLGYGFRLATARQPESRELAVLVKLCQDQLAYYDAHQDAALKLLAVGETKRDESLDPSEHAAYTMLANLILNLDETITKE